MWLGNVQILEHKELCNEIFQMVVAAPEIVARARAGQFLHLRCGKGYDPLLRRPISINRIDRENNTITLLYKVLGQGTARLAEMRAGEWVDVMGPLGNGFTVHGDAPLLIGGGMGIAPLLGLADELKAQAPTMVMGARNAESLLRQHDFAEVCDTLAVATDDGSTGFRGHAPVLAETLLTTKHIDMIYACGPKPMLRYIQKLAATYQIPCQISLEEFMACGVGACLGCTCKAAAQGNPYKKVCTDGPVFWSEEVDLDA